MTIVVVDERGRIYIPSEIRSKLGLRKGSKLRVSIEDGKIVLTIERRGVKYLRRNRAWGKEAFLDAGEALISQ